MMFNDPQKYIIITQVSAINQKVKLAELIVVTNHFSTMDWIIIGHCLWLIVKKIIMSLLILSGQIKNFYLEMLYIEPTYSTPNVGSRKEGDKWKKSMRLQGCRITYATQNLFASVTMETLSLHRRWRRKNEYLIKTLKRRA